VIKKLKWPDFNGVGFDHNVMTCPTPNVPGYINVPGNPNDPNNWCGATSEVSDQKAPRFELSTRPPNE
jgi:hypothetical protein